MVAFSPAMQSELDALRAFLAARVYRHPRIERIMGDAEERGRAISSRATATIRQALPPEWREQARARHAEPMPAMSAISSPA